MRISKWKQYNLMRKSSNLTPYLPETVLFSEENFRSMVEKYKDVVIKPNWGRLGRDILQVSLVDEPNDLYEVHNEGEKETLHGKEQMYAFLEDFCQNRKFVVQQKIRLASIHGCPFDIRVMVQRLPRSPKWCITGTLVRVAEKGFFVTNMAQKLELMEDVIPASNVHDCPLEELALKLRQAALLSAASFKPTYPNCRLIGLDIGIQEDGSLWIIEANFNPMLSLFNYLDDKSMYQTISKYRRGRT